MSAFSNIPLTYDQDFLKHKLAAAGILGNYGLERKPDRFVLRYRDEDFDIVQGILDGYQTDYAEEVLKPKLKAAATARRWEEQMKPTMFNGMPVLTDDVTISRITASAYLMDADPTSPQTRRWKVAEDTWLDFDRDTLVAMGAAIAAHIQACFNREEELLLAINAATTADELNAIDLDAGWPA